MNEQARHRLAFDLYVRLGGGRSLDSLHSALQRDPSQIGLTEAPTGRALERWSSTFHWQDRVLALERQAADQDQQDQVQALREMNERHAREGLALQQKAVERLQTLAANDLTPADAVRALVEGVRLERTARGEGRGRPDDHGGTDDERLTAFTDEELRRLVELASARATGAGEAPAG